MGFCHVAHAGPKPIGSSDSPTSDSQSAEITGVSHRLAPSPKVECSGMIIAHCSLKLLSSSDPLPQPLGQQMEFYSVNKANFKLLASRVPSVLASPNAGITVMSYQAHPAPKPTQCKDKDEDLDDPLPLSEQCVSSCLANFYIFCGDEVSPVGQAGLNVLTSSDLATLASQSAGITH
ncbi:hypothetical protein AAY473_003771, partial [Plecturocebus cupreus]